MGKGRMSDKFVLYIVFVLFILIIIVHRKKTYLKKGLAFGGK